MEISTVSSPRMRSDHLKKEGLKETHGENFELQSSHDATDPNHRFHSMNALEILRETVRILRGGFGIQALVRAFVLIKGQARVGMSIFLGSTSGLTFVTGLFDNRVKTLSYGDGSSRIWEGPLLVVMYSFVMLIDSMMSTVFYFSCRSIAAETSAGERQSMV